MPGNGASNPARPAPIWRAHRPLDTQRALRLFGDWTERIANGELPKAQPPRPQGVERNVVVTVWDWATPKAYLHDEISTDRRNPTVNAYGLIYGSTEPSTDFVPIVDPVKNAKNQVKLPVRDPNTPNTAEDPILAPSPYWGKEPIWDSQANIHNPMFDAKGRVWFTARIRPADDPAFCKAGSDHPSARLFPLQRSGRQAAMYDPKTGKFTPIDLCFTTHHLQFARRQRHAVVQQRRRQRRRRLAQHENVRRHRRRAEVAGLDAFILDTNGNGKRDDYVEPNQPVDPSKDKRIMAGLYGIAPSPVDGSIWGSVLGYPGAVVRVTPGANPPATALTEIYELPTPVRYSPRGMDIDSNGVVWTSLASGHLASFDRQQVQGSAQRADRDRQALPGRLDALSVPGTAVQRRDRHGQRRGELLHLGRSVQHARPRQQRPDRHRQRNDALLALVDGKFVVLRVPYPMGFFAKGMDGRIDDPNGGWKGRGLWSTYGTRTPFHAEGGKDTTSKVVHFQLRPIRWRDDFPELRAGAACMDGTHALRVRLGFRRLCRPFPVNRGAWRHISVKRRCVTMPARAQEPCMVDVQLSVECRLR